MRPESIKFLKRILQWFVAAGLVFIFIEGVLLRLH